MNTSPSPRTRPHSTGLARNIEERRIIQKRRIIMALIVAIGIGIIVWDFLRPRPLPAKLTAPDAPAGHSR